MSCVLRCLLCPLAAGFLLFRGCVRAVGRLRRVRRVDWFLEGSLLAFSLPFLLSARVGAVLSSPPLPLPCVHRSRSLTAVALCVPLSLSLALSSNRRRRFLFCVAASSACVCVLPSRLFWPFSHAGYPCSSSLSSRPVRVQERKRGAAYRCTRLTSPRTSRPRRQASQPRMPRRCSSTRDGNRKALLYQVAGKQLPQICLLPTESPLSSPRTPRRRTSLLCWAGREPPPRQQRRQGRTA